MIQESRITQKVQSFTNAYKHLLSDTGFTYGHKWTDTCASELLQHDSVLIYDRALGGSQGALHRRWDGDAHCFGKYHNDLCIEIGKSDQIKLVKFKKRDWREPSKRERDLNKRHVKSLKKRSKML